MVLIIVCINGQEKVSEMILQLPNAKALLEVSSAAMVAARAAYEEIVHGQMMDEALEQLKQKNEVLNN